MTAPGTTRRECEAGCGKPAADGWGICRGCHRRTGMHLSDIAGDLTAEMETTLTGQGRTGPDRVGSRSSVIPLPFDPQASAVAQALALISIAESLANASHDARAESWAKGYAAGSKAEGTDR